MSREQNNSNYSAYPQVAFDDRGALTTLGMQEFQGLTKREYFAGLAMQGLCSYNGTMNEHNVESTIRRSIEIADELLKQLEK